MKSFTNKPAMLPAPRGHTRRNLLFILNSTVLLFMGTTHAAPLPQPGPTKAEPQSTHQKNTRQTSGIKNKKSVQTARQPSSINIEQQSTEPVDPQLRDAYLAYRSGKLDEAQPLYLAMYWKDARNPDVLLGLASIAQQRGETLKAAHYFSRVLVLDPRNATANAAMSALSSSDDNSESRLKILLDEQENSAALHFALGNIYAGQSRWGEAQQHYFSAHLLEPGNAVFVFNLAVSLDHLGQSRLAVQHYRHALKLDERHNAGFDHAPISQRIEELARDENAG